MRKQASALIKEFKMTDLRRMRNLKDGKLHDSTVTQSGYDKVEIVRKEGEVFTENGKEYIIEGGIKKHNSKFRNLRSLVKIPLFCPCCNKPLNLDIDKRMYNIRQMCLDCNIKVESKMKLEGTFKEYQKQFMKDNYKSELIDMKKYLEDFGKQKSIIVNSEGFAEDIQETNIDLSNIIKSIDDELEQL